MFDVVHTEHSDWLFHGYRGFARRIRQGCVKTLLLEEGCSAQGSVILLISELAIVTLVCFFPHGLDDAVLTSP